MQRLGVFRKKSSVAQFLFYRIAAQINTCLLLRDILFSNLWLNTQMLGMLPCLLMCELICKTATLDTLSFCPTLLLNPSLVQPISFSKKQDSLSYNKRENKSIVRRLTANKLDQGLGHSLSER